jgi:hypothetical protein
MSSIFKHSSRNRAGDLIRRVFHWWTFAKQWSLSIRYCISWTCFFPAHTAAVVPPRSAPSWGWPITSTGLLPCWPCLFHPTSTPLHISTFMNAFLAAQQHFSENTLPHTPYQAPVRNMNRISCQSTDTPFPVKLSMWFQTRSVNSV